jgi:hypothetical protein
MRLFALALLVAGLLSACNNQPAPAAKTTAAAILKHKYWVSKPFNDALFAANIPDTLSFLPCGELVFDRPDTLIFTSCLSDAGIGSYKSTSANTLELRLEGLEGTPATLTLDEKTGVLRLSHPNSAEGGWPTEFVPQDAIDVSNLDNVTISLARQRLAGKYTVLPPKGGVATTALVELRTDGTQVGLGDFDKYEPWPTGIGSATQSPTRNVMYLMKNGKEVEGIVVAWQARGDTLRLWDTKNVSAPDEMEMYTPAALRGTYVRVK